MSSLSKRYILYLQKIASSKDTTFPCRLTILKKSYIYLLKLMYSDKGKKTHTQMRMYRLVLWLYGYILRLYLILRLPNLSLRWLALRATYIRIVTMYVPHFSCLTGVLTQVVYGCGHHAVHVHDHNSMFTITQFLKATANIDHTFLKGLHAYG